MWCLRLPLRLCHHKWLLDYSSVVTSLSTILDEFGSCTGSLPITSRTGRSRSKRGAGDVPTTTRTVPSTPCEEEEDKPVNSPRLSVDIPDETGDELGAAGPHRGDIPLVPHQPPSPLGTSCGQGAESRGKG